MLITTVWFKCARKHQVKEKCWLTSGGSDSGGQCGFVGMV